MKKILFILCAILFSSSIFAKENITTTTAPQIIKCGIAGEGRCYAGRQIGIFFIEKSMSAYPYFIIDGTYQVRNLSAQQEPDDNGTLAPSVAEATYQNVDYPQITFNIQSSTGWYASSNGKSWHFNGGSTRDSYCNSYDVPSNVENCGLIYLPPNNLN